MAFQGVFKHSHIPTDAGQKILKKNTKGTGPVKKKQNSCKALNHTQPYRDRHFKKEDKSALFRF